MFLSPGLVSLAWFLAQSKYTFNVKSPKLFSIFVAGIIMYLPFFTLNVAIHISFADLIEPLDLKILLLSNLL